MPDKSDLYVLKRNLYYYLRNEVLFDEYNINDFSFSDTIENEVLVRNETISQRYDMAYSNLVYNVAAYSVTVYRNGFEVDPINYAVNYKNGYILFEDGYVVDEIEEITATYSRMLIKTMLAFNYEDVDSSDLPIIAIDLESTEKSPVELGTTLSYKERNVYFIVYASNEIELDNIVSVLEGSFDENRIQMMNYRQQQPLDEDGFLNPAFSGNQYDDYEMSIEHIKTDNLYPSTPNEIDKYSMMVQSDIRSFI